METTITTSELETTTETKKVPSQYVASILVGGLPTVLTAKTQSEMKKQLNSLGSDTQILSLVKGKLFDARPKRSFDIVKDAH